jgi:RNA polymerase sigma-70 factor (ECF subfamily)
MSMLSPARSDHGYDAARASDQALMNHIAEGDAEAFEEIYRRHSRHALIQARKLCASRELAEEVAQETFVSLWRSAHRYRPGLGSVSVWLSSMVRNRAIDAWRRAAVRPVETPAYEDGPGQLRTAVGANTAPERAAVLALIAELPPPQKEAVFLAYFGGMTHAEIADWTHAPIGTIKGRIRLGLEKLRAGLDEQAQPSRPQPSGPQRSRPQPSRPALKAVPTRVDVLEPGRRRRAGAQLAPRTA